MAQIISNSGRIGYGLKHYLVQDKAELDNLPFLAAQRGNTVFVIEENANYVFDKHNKPVRISAGLSSGGGSVDGDIEVEDLPMEEIQAAVIEDMDFATPDEVNNMLDEIFVANEEN